jgi:hypothetical protein
VKRAALVLGLSLMFCVAGFAMLAIQSLEQRMAAQGIQWTDRTISISQISWSDLTGPGVSIQKLTARPSWPVQIQTKNVVFDPSGFNHPSNTPTTQTTDENSWQLPIQGVPIEVHTQQLTISWKDRTWLQGLSGQLYPQVSLSRGDDHFTATRDPKQAHHWSGHASISLPWDGLTGTATIQFDLGDFLEVSVTCPEAIASHPFLMNQSMPRQPLNTRMVWKPDTGEIAAEGQFGNVAWSAIGTTDTESHDIRVRVPMTELSSVVGLFGPLIPEANGATLTGELGLAAHITGPPWTWSFEPAAQELSVADALPADFGGDRIRWTRNGVAFETGPSVAGWVSLDQAGWMPEAAIAAEDIRFRTHPGFDLVAIQEALDASVNEERMRGGSTITQQLAKNLFLDGRRTLLRKLRELVFALNMESRMSKDAILALYLNVVEFGPGIHGVSEAANAWFMKNPDQLSAREAAFLTSILPAPQMWHKRITKTKRVPIKRVNEVLNRMRRRGTLSASQHRRAIQERLRVVPP